MEVKELLQLALESGDIVQFIRLSSLGSPQESNKKVQQTRNEENNSQNYDDQKDAWTNLQGPIVQTETIRSNSSSGWDWWLSLVHAACYICSLCLLFFFKCLRMVMCS